MFSQVNYFLNVFSSPVLWMVAIVCVTLFLVGLAYTLRTSLHLPAHAPADVSLLSPTLATELLGPHAARAWLLAVALDLYARDLPAHLDQPRTLGRLARLRLIHMRDERDHEAVPIAAALAACCHQCALMLDEGPSDDDMRVFDAAQDVIRAATLVKE
jgi:hypothetical protein